MAAEAVVDFIGKDEKLERSIKNIENQVSGMGSKIKGAMGAAMAVFSAEKILGFATAILDVARESDEFKDRVGAIDETIKKVQLTVAKYLIPVIESLLDIGIKTFSALQTGWEKLGDVWQITVDSMQLGAVVYFNELVHHLTVRIPGYITWFSENWRDIFTDIFIFTGTVTDNLLTNFKDMFANIFKILNGETADWKWKGLTEGFKSSIKELPQIAEREKSELEKTLADRIATNSSSVASAFTSNQDANKNQFQGRGQEAGIALGKGIEALNGFIKGKSFDGVTKDIIDKTVGAAGNIKQTAGELAGGLGKQALGLFMGETEETKEEETTTATEDIKTMIARISNAAAGSPELAEQKKTAENTKATADASLTIAGGIERLNFTLGGGLKAVFGP